ncbi:MAG: DHHA1 domain-containing protein, partial [Pseudomonadales bacterium]|nr:DHHA1 domain-containing protein [Pseudomonadales bacterium]
ALRRGLGEHVSQKGSLVDPDKLRFDFSHFEAVTPVQLAEIEAMVNEQVRKNTPVQTELTDMESAKEKGAMALFGEKYGDTVRVLTMGEDRFSVELCGGTHVQRTGDIGSFVIVSEGGISAGVRRIEAITGEKAELWRKQSDTIVAELGGLVKAGRDVVVEKVKALSERNRQLEKEIEQLKSKLAASAGADLISQAKDVAGIKVLAAELPGADRKTLLETADQLKNKLGSAVVLLATVENDKVVLVAGVTKDITGQYKAGELMKDAAQKLGGKGGGRPDMAQGGGTDVASLPEVLAGVADWVAARG